MSTVLPNAQNAPLGASLLAGGVAFRTWAPRATEVYVIGDFSAWQPVEAGRLQALGDGTWAGLVPGLGLDALYQFQIVGQGSSGWKRDPRARLLAFQPPFPDCPCVVRDPGTFPWHDTGWRAPAFNDLILYQLHVGTFRITPGKNDGKFLDVALQLPYFAALGINALQLMPTVEFETEFSLGYNGCDYFSPENQYGLEAAADLQNYLAEINGLLTARGQAAYADSGAIAGPDNQLRALVDLCHVWGIAVLFDVVYNHAGGFTGDDHSIYFFDRLPPGQNNAIRDLTEKACARRIIFSY